MSSQDGSNIKFILAWNKLQIHDKINFSKRIIYFRYEKQKQKLEKYQTLQHKLKNIK